MLTEIAEALKGNLYILAVALFSPFYTMLLIICSMQIQSWIPTLLGLSAYLAIVIRILRKREEKHVQDQMKPFPMSPELQAQRFDDYEALLRKHEKP